MNKRIKDIGNILILILIVLGLVLFMIKDGYIFGSNIDYLLQHSVFPDYLRTLFYETKDLFPDFMPHIGSGQNIYNISYYGLYNPIIMFSYLLPFVSMIEYLVVVSCISVMISGALFYIFLIKHKYSRIISFLGALLLISASPVLFHSHRHIMFVNYLPFLILGFYGIDRYITKRKSGLLIFSLTMIIYCSYYYSVGAFLTLFIYMVYSYLKINKQIKLKTLFKMTYPYIISILLGALILLPTIEVLLSGRNFGSSSVALADLFIPSNGLLYSAYSMGLSIFSLLAIIYAVFKFKLLDKLLALFILFISTIPVFSYILNGFLYIDFKSLIPFIPLALIITVMFLEDIYKNKYIKYIMSTLIISISLISVIYINSKDSFIDKEEYYENQSLITKVNNYLKSIDDSYYKVSYLNNLQDNINVTNEMYRSTIYSSTQNMDYHNFYHNTLKNDNSVRNSMMIAPSENLISQIYLSEKYIVTKKELNNNYKLLHSIDDYNIYENILVLPLGYATSSIINTIDYNKLEPQNKMINLLGNIICENDTSTEIITLNKYEYKINVNEDVLITKNDDKYTIEVLNDTLLEITTDINSMALLSFEISPQEKDFIIKANDISNKLTDINWKYYNNNETFSYVIDKADKIKLQFTKGIYNIKNVGIYEIKSEYLYNDITPFNLDMKKTKGDYIIGDVTLEKDSMFVLNIPYDDNFIIKVNEEIIDYEKVNETFIGFNLEKGYSSISIEYKNDIKSISLFISATSLLITLLYFTIFKNIKYSV